MFLVSFSVMFRYVLKSIFDVFSQFFGLNLFFLSLIRLSIFEVFLFFRLSIFDLNFNLRRYILDLIALFQHFSILLSFFSILRSYSFFSTLDFRSYSVFSTFFNFWSSSVFSRFNFLTSSASQYDSLTIFRNRTRTVTQRFIPITEIK